MAKRRIPKQYKQAYYLGAEQRSAGYEWASCPYINCVSEWYWKQGWHYLPLIHHLDWVDMPTGWLSQ